MSYRRNLLGNLFGHLLMSCPVVGDILLTFLIQLFEFGMERETPHALREVISEGLETFKVSKF